MKSTKEEKMEDKQVIILKLRNLTEAQLQSLPVKDKKEIIEWVEDHALWSYPLENGSVWQDFHDCVDIGFAYVNPETLSIDEDESKNTLFQVWLEGGGWFDASLEDHLVENNRPDEGWNENNKWWNSHDIRLDVGANDLETALVLLAKKVAEYYDTDGSEIVSP